MIGICGDYVEEFADNFRLCRHDRLGEAGGVLEQTDE